MIYADNAATSRLDADALAEMQRYLTEEYGNISQPYAFSRNPKKNFWKAREMIAHCINANPEEIFITSCGTESDNWALKGTLLFSPKKQGIITSIIEHHAILNPCKTLNSLGYPVKYLSVDADGMVSEDELRNLITPTDRLVSIMMVNNEIGTIQHIKELAKIAHQAGLIFHTDAVQAVGHISIDVKDLDIDMLSASAHKFNGPKGIGFLYVRNGIELHPLIEGGGQENGQRAGTENVASVVGMAVALKKNCAIIEQNKKHLQQLEKKFFDILDSAELDYRKNGGTHRVPGNINISIRHADGEMILHRLDLMHIYISTGSACNGKDTTISHVIEAIGVPAEYAKGTIRISFGHDNTVSDAENLAKALIKILL